MNCSAERSPLGERNSLAKSVGRRRNYTTQVARSPMNKSMTPRPFVLMNELSSCSLCNFFNQPRRHCEFHTPAQNQSPLGAPPDTFYTECKLANTQCIQEKKTAPSRYFASHFASWQGSFRFIFAAECNNNAAGVRESGCCISLMWLTRS